LGENRHNDFYAAGQYVCSLDLDFQADELPQRRNPGILATRSKEGSMGLRCSVQSLFSMVLLLSGAGMAARAQDLFVTPVPDAPFHGTVVVERTIVQPNGSVTGLRTMREIGRDSQGRIHNESRTLVPLSSTATPTLVQIHLYDPQTRISTMISPPEKIFWTRTVNRPPETEPPTLANATPTAAYQPPNQYAKQEDLGTREIAGLQAHGVRATQTISAATSGMGKDVIVTDEYWYSNDLRINLVTKHSDPRTGSVALTVTEVDRGEPDAALFAIPEGYTQAGMGRSQ
jgi:hypothetical protein